jgi:hypothetical protein
LLVSCGLEDDDPSSFLKVRKPIKAPGSRIGFVFASPTHRHIRFREFDEHAGPEALAPPRHLATVGMLASNLPFWPIGGAGAKRGGDVAKAFWSHFPYNARSGDNAMPIHDWSRVPSGLFHDFHQSWSIRIKDALNSGRLPRGVAALVEQRAGPRESDVLAIEVRPKRDLGEELDGGIATLPPPVTRIVRRTTKEIYASRANRIVVKHHLGRIIAVIEILSPGNKDSRAALRDFVEKTVDCLRKGIHVLIVDVFPPTQRDPYGIHKLIWDEIVEEDFTFPDGKDRILVSYKTGGERAAYIEPVTVGDALPDMPLFLTNDLHVMVPLEQTYQATWDASPEDLRIAVETGLVPEPEAE